MAMKQVLTAPQPLTYEPFDGVADVYNTDLVTPPRVYQQSINSIYNEGSSFTGTLWSTNDPNLYGPSSIQVMAVMECNDWPGHQMRRWKLDGKTGILLDASSFPTVATGPLVYGKFTVDPNGTIWEYNGHPFVDDDGAVQINNTTLDSIPETIIHPDDFSGHSGDVIEVFGIDLAANLCWIQWGSSTSIGRIDSYKLSDKSLQHSFRCPNQILGVVPNGQGHVYVYDSANWVCVYTYDGVLRGAFKNGNPADYPGSFVYGWDKQYMRLLFLGGTADAVDGACTVVPVGFYPTPEQFTMTVPIPKSVPRKGRTTYFFSRVVGSGGEPCAGLPVEQSGTVENGGLSTDAQGDVLGAVTPADTTAVTVTFEAPDP